MYLILSKFYLDCLDFITVNSRMLGTSNIVRVQGMNDMNESLKLVKNKK